VLVTANDTQVSAKKLPKSESKQCSSTMTQPEHPLGLSNPSLDRESNTIFSKISRQQNEFVCKIPVGEILL